MIWCPEDIEQFERVYAVTCTLRPDGMYDVKGDIEVEEYYLVDFCILPPIHTFNGNLRLFTSAENLIGSPRCIVGNFSCGTNLKTLDGAPEYVGRFFNCMSNVDLIFTQSELDAMNIQGLKFHKPSQLVSEDPKEFIRSIPI